MESLLEKRLRLIDFYLLFFGKVNRADLIRHGDVSIATASRTFNKYRELYSDNAVFDVSKKCYVRSPQFRAGFEHDAFAALKMAAWGIEENKVDSVRCGVENYCQVMDHISVDTVSHIIHAIINKQCLKVTYRSSNSNSERYLSPHTLFHGLGAWHVRCWDHTKDSGKGKALSFRLSRISSSQVASDKTYIGSEMDEEWNSHVTLSVAPHSQHDNRDNLVMELGMEGKPVRNIQTNAVLAGYVLNDLRVDCSEMASLPAKMFNLQLMNRHELEDVESIQSLAPGFFEIS